MTGRAGLVLFAAWGVVLAYPSAATATPDKPKIVIMKPEVRGAITEGVGYNVFIQLETAIRDMFPCASVLTMDDAATIISVAKDRRTLGSGEAAEDTLKAVGKQMDADLVISISMRTRGTTHNDPGRNLSTTVLDARRSEALEKTSAEGEGWDWSSKDLIKETIDRLRGTADDFCPWQGTVVYQRRVQVDTQKSAGRRRTGLEHDDRQEHRQGSPERGMDVRAEARAPRRRDPHARFASQDEWRGKLRRRDHHGKQKLERELLPTRRRWRRP
jgi:hypothetical protein